MRQRAITYRTDGAPTESEGTDYCSDCGLYFPMDELTEDCVLCGACLEAELRQIAAMKRAAAAVSELVALGGAIVGEEPDGGVIDSCTAREFRNGRPNSPIYTGAEICWPEGRLVMLRTDGAWLRRGRAPSDESFLPVGRDALLIEIARSLRETHPERAEDLIRETERRMPQGEPPLPRDDEETLPIYFVRPKPRQVPIE